MKVVLSIDPIRYPLTGIGRYTLELARHLQTIPDLELKYFLRSRFVDELPVAGDSAPAREAFGSRLKQTLIKVPFVVGVAHRLDSLRKRLALKNYADHVYHGPNFYLPPTPGPCTATIHDLSVYTWSDHHPPERARFLRKQMEATLKRASILITDSEYTRREVADFFGWPLHRIRAVPLAAAPEFHPRPADQIAAHLEHYGLRPGAYCLYTGTIEPRKNLDALVTAYSRLPEATRSRWPLVLCGYRGWKSDALHRRLVNLQPEGWLRYIGYVPEQRLPALMSGARAFAYPSLYEGFGLPVVEAMASGVPVVASNAASLAEVAGEAALTFDPGDVQALTGLLQRALEDEAWREEAGRKGLAWSKRFSWANCARETASVYADLQ